MSIEHRLVPGLLLKRADAAPFPHTCQLTRRSPSRHPPPHTPCSHPYQHTPGAPLSLEWSTNTQTSPHQKVRHSKCVGWGWEERGAMLCVHARDEPVSRKLQRHNRRLQKTPLCYHTRSPTPRRKGYLGSRLSSRRSSPCPELCQCQTRSSSQHPCSASQPPTR